MVDLQKKNSKLEILEQNLDDLNLHRDRHLAKSLTSNGLIIKIKNKLSSNQIMIFINL